MKNEKVYKILCPCAPTHFPLCQMLVVILQRILEMPFFIFELFLINKINKKKTDPYTMY
jgi:hypothetical protein